MSNRKSNLNPGNSITCDDRDVLSAMSEAMKRIGSLEAMAIFFGWDETHEGLRIAREALQREIETHLTQEESDTFFYEDMPPPKSDG